MKDENRFWKLVGKKFAGEATEQDLHELERLTHENPEWMESVEIISAWWSQNKAVDTKEEAELESKLERLLQRIKKEELMANEMFFKKGKKKISLSHFVNETLMFKNYFKIAWRNLIRGGTLSVINITGLAVGMAGAILVMVWIAQQLSFDQFHQKKERIYQLYNRSEQEGQKIAWSGTSSLLGPAIKSNYPQVEEMFRTNWVANLIFTTGEKHLEAQGVFTDPGFLRSLDFPLLHGDKNRALNNPESVILTESFSKKLFGNEDPTGKAIRVDSNANFIVTGIIKDPPPNTRFSFEYLMPMEYRKKINWEIAKWDDYGVETYVLLKKGVTEQTANALFRNIIKRNMPEMKNEVFVHPMRKWYLYSNFENGVATGSGIKGVRLFGIIGAFILLIACINYMNLSTAKSEKRGREVGIRKVVGARKSSLLLQFIGESILMTLVAGILALVIAELSIGWFSQLVYANLSIPYYNPMFWIYGILFILVTGILAGSYPALYLAARRPVSVLKGAFKAAGALVTPRKVLVVFQFSFAIVFIICTIIVYRQIKLGQHRDTGFDANNLTYIYLRGNINKHYPAIKSQLYSSGAIESVTRSNSPLTFIWTSDNSFEWQGKDPNLNIGFATYYSDADFAKTMGLKILAGRDINSSVYPTDSMAVLLNESAVKKIGLQQPVGQFLKNSQGNWQIVGIVKDFTTGSAYYPAEPVIIEGPKNWLGTLSFRLNKNKPIPDNLAKIDAILKKFNPDYPSGFVFADEDIQRQFVGQRHTGKLAALFAGLAIFISCLGLFALASYMATNRIKEIGVRKVLGASVMSITTMLSKEFVKLVMISVVFASPVAWWMMHSWLNGYVYRVDISWWVFALTALLSITIALVTVSFQAIKAAVANPVNSLRTE